MTDEQLREDIAKKFYSFDVRRWHKQGSTGLPMWEFIKKRPLDSKPYYKAADHIMSLVRVNSLATVDGIFHLILTDICAGVHLAQVDRDYQTRYLKTKDFTEATRDRILESLKSREGVQ